jgi:hypothetical protein
MSNSVITRNLTDQSGNFGEESVISQLDGSTRFVNPLTGETQRRSISATTRKLDGSPFDNSFQIDSQSYNVSRGLFQQQGVPDNLSNTFGAITAVTAKDLGVSANQLFDNGRPSHSLLENINFFRTSHSQIGFNTGDATPPYLNNLMLGAKIFNQTS